MQSALLRRAVRCTGAILLMAAFCLQGSSLLVAQAQPSEAYALVEAVNIYRASLGLPRLTTSDALMIAAQRHVEWMAANARYSHIGEGGSMPEDRAATAGFGGSVRENVGGSTWATPEEMIFFWDNSYIHQVAMRAAQATHIGAGFAANDEQRLFVLLIGTASDQPPQAGSAPIAGGAPAIAYTPPPGLVWTTDGETHEGSNYVSADAPPGVQAPATQAAYVMPFELIRRAEPDADGAIVHRVEVGQTAWAIAARYGVDLQALIRLNRLGENPVLHPGDTLIIRLGEGQAPPPEPTAARSIVVQEGDSLWSIAARSGQSVTDLRAWNNLSAGAIIQPGEALLVAPPEPTESASPESSATPAMTSASPSTYEPAALPSLTVPATLLPTLTPTQTQTAQPISSPSPGASPTWAAPASVALVPTAPSAEVQETESRSPQQAAEFILLLLFVGVAAAFATVLGSLVTWLAHKGRHRRASPRP